MHVKMCACSDNAVDVVVPMSGQTHQNISIFISKHYFHAFPPQTSSYRRMRSGGFPAMNAARLEQQVASVERGIAFLKQEHLAMLTGLQLEITHLKRRCHGQPAGLLPLTVTYTPLCRPASCPHVLMSSCPFSLCAELSCELDSRFPDRNTAGKELHTFADLRKIASWKS